MSANEADVFASTVGWLLTIAIWLILMAIARKMAARKNRSSIWVLLTFLFAPLLLILWILPNRESKENGDGNTEGRT